MRTRNLMSGFGRKDSGAVLVITAVFIIVAVIFLAAVIDLGGLREQRKDVTLSTDSAALAAAAEAVLDGKSPGTYDCSAIPSLTSGLNVRDIAFNYLAVNRRSVAKATFPCEFVITATNSGYVVVGADETVDYAFGQAIGQVSGSVDGVSIAAVESNPGGGVRPIAMCAFESSLNEKAPGVSYSIATDVLTAPSTLDPDGSRKLVTPVDIVIEKNHLKKSVNACGTDDAAGQRGQLQFGTGGDGGQCNNSPKNDSYADNIANGWFGALPKRVDQDSGNNFNTVKPCLTNLVTNNTRFWVPVYDDYVKEKGKDGATYYDIEHFLEAELQGYCINKDEYEDPAQYNCEYVIQAGSGKGKDAIPEITSEWYRMLIHRVYTPTSYPVAPPKTSDAKTLPPVICGEVDTAEARLDCIP